MCPMCPGDIFISYAALEFSCECANNGRRSFDMCAVTFSLVSFSHLTLTSRGSLNRLFQDHPLKKKGINQDQSALIYILVIGNSMD